MKLILWLTVLLWTSCDTVQESGQNFDQEQEWNFAGYYTQAVLDSSRYWHSPEDTLEVLIRNLRVLSTCTILPPAITETPDKNGLWILFENQGALDVNCPMGTSDFDTLLYFPPDPSWATRDTIYFYGMSTVQSDTVPTDSIKENNLIDRFPVPIDTLYLALGQNYRDTFLFETDSFRVYEQETPHDSLVFGLIKAPLSDSLDTLIYSEWKYTCQEDSYESCSKNGIEWDTLDNKYLISDSLRLVKPETPDTLKREIFQICSNGKILCSLSFRKDSLVVSPEKREWTFRDWYSYFWEKTGTCSEWNLRKVFNYGWLPSGPNPKWQRRAKLRIERERFEKTDCQEEDPEHLRFLNLHTGLEVVNQDTIQLIMEKWQP